MRLTMVDFLLVLKGKDSNPKNPRIEVRWQALHPCPV